MRPPEPVLFPETDPEWELGQSTLHFDLCALLRRILLAAVGEHGTAGSDQFLYFDAANPRRKCAPDGFVKLGVAQSHFPSWKTWKGGVPELCVEIQSPLEMEKLTLEEKLARYHQMGVAEVLVYDPDAPVGMRVRAWDWIDGDQVERVVEAEKTPCLTLGLYWVLVQDPALGGDALRLAEDPDGTRLVLTAEEAVAARERARADAAEGELARLREELARLKDR